MSYRDSIQRGSFRNVPFFIDVHTLDGGRRAVLHEFPERDDPYTEDLGRRGRSYALEFHIIGENYFSQRDAMIRALERKDSGVLIHPYLGRQDVQVTNFSLTESITEGRICRFLVTFVERGRSINPIGIFGSVFAVFDTVNQYIEDLRGEFEQILDFANYPSYVLDSFLGVGFEIVDTFNEAIGIIPATVNDFASIQGSIEDLGTSFVNAATQPLEVFDLFTSTQNGLTTVTPNHSEKQQILDYVISYEDTNSYSDLTPNRQQEQANNDILKRTVKGVAIAQKISWLTQAVTRPFDVTIDEMATLENDDVFSISDLERKRDEILAIADGFLESYPDLESRTTFYALRATFISAIDEATESLEIKKTINFNTKATEPALVLCYDQTESIDVEEDFIQRNRIRHPAFVPGGKSFEIVEF